MMSETIFKLLSDIALQDINWNYNNFKIYSCQLHLKLREYCLQFRFCDFIWFCLKLKKLAHFEVNTIGHDVNAAIHDMTEINVNNCCKMCIVKWGFIQLLQSMMECLMWGYDLPWREKKADFVAILCSYFWIQL